MYIQVLTTVFHFLWCYILIDVYDLGASGAGIATTFTHFLTMAGCHVYTSYVLTPELKLKAWFHPFKQENKHACFDKQGLIDFFKKSIPSTGMLCLEWWAFEIMIFFSAFISIKATAA